MGLILIVSVLMLAACSTNDETNNGSDEEKVSASATNWEEAANLAEYDTTEELYEKAKEEGEVVVYSATSAVEKVGLAFEEEYPDVTAVVTKVSDPDIFEKINREHESGVKNADVILDRKSVV